VNWPQGFRYYPAFLTEAEADRLLHCLRQELQWQQYPIRLFGRELLQPRLSAWYADPGVRYRYSGIQLDPLPWHPVLAHLREHLLHRLGLAFNSVLANAYRDGRDAMGWHADDEPELGSRPVIASLSLGQVRSLRLRPRAGGASAGYSLENGSLLIMEGDSQNSWQHAVPRTRRVQGLRINLTFRRVFLPDEVDQALPRPA